METTNINLEEQYVNAATRLGELCAKYLSKGWTIDIDNLIVRYDGATGTYNGKDIVIRFVEDRKQHTNELVLSFCCDDIPLMHMPIRMLVTDGSEVRTAYYEMFNAYANYTFQRET